MNKELAHQCYELDLSFLIFFLDCTFLTERPCTIILYIAGVSLAVSAFAYLCLECCAKVSYNQPSVYLLLLHPSINVRNSKDTFIRLSTLIATDQSHGVGSHIPNRLGGASARSSSLGDRTWR
jgi:hypothetical protein